MGQEVFAGIARRYDTLNRILSLGREQSWRRRGADRLPSGRLLDLGAGTGAALPVFGDREVVALDPVPEMLAFNPASARVVAIGEALPFADGSFDGVFSAYVFRNLTSISDTLREINRVLRPGGKAVVVGLGRPRGALLRPSIEPVPPWFCLWPGRWSGRGGNTPTCTGRWTSCHRRKSSLPRAP